jgi:hypothetical protein
LRICRTRGVRLSLAVLVGLLASAPSARAVVTIEVNPTSGAPGSTATFQVTLSTGGAEVGGTLNTVSVDAATPLVACTTNPGLTLSECSLQPQGCTAGVNCQAVRCFIAQLAAPPPAIPDGTLLYQCSVKIAANATGTHQLVCSDASASDTAANTLDTQCPPGQVQTGMSLCCGDIDGNGAVSVSEVTKAVIALVNRDFSADPAAQCTTPGVITTSDVTNIISNLVSRWCSGVL